MAAEILSPSSDPFIVRGRESDAPHLPDVERSAGTMFAAIGMHEIANNEPSDVERLAERAREGRLLIAARRPRVPVGFIYWSMKDGFAYIEEVSIRAEERGRRLGARLIERLAHEVQGIAPSLTLATFRDVAWNAPYYMRLGFTPCGLQELGPDHAQAWRDQEVAGLDMSRRLFMRRGLGS